MNTIALLCMLASVALLAWSLVIVSAVFGISAVLIARAPYADPEPDDGDDDDGEEAEPPIDFPELDDPEDKGTQAPGRGWTVPDAGEA